MKKLCLFSILFVFSVNVNAAPTLSWSTNVDPTPGTIPFSMADGVVAHGSGTGNLAGAVMFSSVPAPLPFGTMGPGAFSHDWVFSASELTDLSAIALTTDSLTGVSVSLDGVMLSSFSFGAPVPFVGSLTLWNSVFENLGSGDHTLNFAGTGLSGVFGGYAFSLAAGEPTGGHGPEISPVPIPATVWLFGSALLGVSGLASRRKTIVA